MKIFSGISAVVIDGLDFALSNQNEDFINLKPEQRSDLINRSRAGNLRQLNKSKPVLKLDIIVLRRYLDMAYTRASIKVLQDKNKIRFAFWDAVCK
jgi:hypothetical protein